jgi:hypothetical protein
LGHIQEGARAIAGSGSTGAGTPAPATLSHKAVATPAILLFMFSAFHLRLPPAKRMRLPAPPCLGARYGAPAGKPAYA